MSNEPSALPELQLSDDEGVMFLKIVRNNPYNHVKNLAIRETEVVITFRDGIPAPAHIPREEALAWKDRDWREFFKAHEPLM